jgi:hypothetical protein
MPKMSGNMVLPKVVNRYKESFTLSIMRPSRWGNPFSWEEGTLAKYLVTSREEAVAAYEPYARERLWDQLDMLSGHVLGCCCKPKSCHGDVLVRLFAEKFGLNL